MISEQYIYKIKTEILQFIKKYLYLCSKNEQSHKTLIMYEQ